MVDDVGLEIMQDCPDAVRIPDVLDVQMYLGLDVLEEAQVSSLSRKPVNLPTLLQVKFR